MSGEWLERLMFQHTATRRWLPSGVELNELALRVSTHSHPKVAAANLTLTH